MSEQREPGSELLAAVKAEFPDDQDPLTLLLWDLTEGLGDAEDVEEIIALSGEIRALMAAVEARRPPAADELAERRRRKVFMAGS